VKCSSATISAVAANIGGSGAPRGQASAWRVARARRCGGVAEFALAGRPEPFDPLAIGLQHRHVDGVERGPGHESEHEHASLTAMMRPG
jgi:hypothetical protein